MGKRVIQSLCHWVNVKVIRVKTLLPSPSACCLLLTAAWPLFVNTLFIYIKKIKRLLTSFRRCLTAIGQMHLSPSPSLSIVTRFPLPHIFYAVLWHARTNDCHPHRMTSRNRTRKRNVRESLRIIIIMRNSVPVSNARTDRNMRDCVCPIELFLIKSITNAQ